VDTTERKWEIELVQFFDALSSVACWLKPTWGLFVWAVCGWLWRESCCAEKAAVQGKLLFRVLVFGYLAGWLTVC
jgi:DNA-binding transcriptional MocR family regulator